MFNYIRGFLNRESINKFIYIIKKICLIFQIYQYDLATLKKQFPPPASGLVKFVFLRYLNNHIVHKNSNAFYNINTLDICSVS